ncbi:APC family permease [Alicyclobacillus sp. ALC3]|uniref:APC family permease n=1 Tax=Alicyclobacillus sp. ALC3 TaxID=2796143 RepID=UPI002379937C|nr:APC family permease [Alicyclobacillus sp. ALC3]WDL97619.1 APC family permease [Alicyclobacillus sp. ALC3]
MNEDHLLKRRMGFWSLTAASLGGVIGSGWLLGAMYAAQSAGPASILSWVIGGVALGLVALGFIEMTRVRSISGGLVRYPQETNGSLVAAIIGWAIWLAYSANPPTEASGIIQYLSKLMPGLYNGTQLTASGILVAILIMIVFVVINYFGVHIFAKVNLVVTTLKFIVPTLTLIGLFASGFHASNFTSHGGFAPYGWSAGLSAIATSGVIFAYTGFRAAIDLAGEAVNPRRDIPRAVLTALGIAIVLYIGLELAFVGAVPGSSLVQGWHGVNFNSPFAQLATSVNLMWLSWLIYADSTFSPAGSSVVYTATNARVVYGLALNRFFPKFLAKVNPRYGVPGRAMLLNFVVGLLFLLPFKSWHSIIEITGALGIFTYASGSASVLIYRRSGKTQPEDRIRGMGWIAPAGFVVASLIIYWAGWSVLNKTLPLLIVGAVLYLVAFFVNRQSGRELTGGLWLLAFLVLEFVLSYLGSFDGIKAIPAPWDSVLVAVLSLAIFFWAVASGTSYMGKTDTISQSAPSEHANLEA